MERSVGGLLVVDFANDGRDLPHVCLPWNGCGYGEGRDYQADNDCNRSVHLVLLHVASPQGIQVGDEFVHLGEETVSSQLIHLSSSANPSASQPVHCEPKELQTAKLGAQA